jgi:hypothetical protein
MAVITYGTLAGILYNQRQHMMVHSALSYIISYHITSFIPFRRSVQDYKIHMDMEMVIFIQVMLYSYNVYNSYMVHNIWLNQAY